MIELLLAMQLQTSVLMYHDVYTCTKEHIGTYYYNDPVNYLPSEEMNLVAKMFTDSNNYDLLFALCGAGNYFILSNLHNEGEIMAYSLLISMFEIWAIRSWAEPHYIDIQIQTTPVIVRF